MDVEKLAMVRLEASDEKGLVVEVVHPERCDGHHLNRIAQKHLVLAEELMQVPGEKQRPHCFQDDFVNLLADPTMMIRMSYVCDLPVTSLLEEQSSGLKQLRFRFGFDGAECLRGL